MSVTETADIPENGGTEQISKEFVLEDFGLNPLSSADLIKKESYIVAEEDGDILTIASAPPLNSIENSDMPESEERDPIFAALAEPELPELERENRARLQMQSPTRLFFYWSIKSNPFQVLQKAFGGKTGSYQLVAKLIDQTREREEILPVETEGNRWFNVDAASRYKAEIGFYAPNRPFVRVMFSNEVETPRKNPSSRQASDADWAVTATEFAEVLDVSGFTRDAFEVALAGDDEQLADNATDNAFYQVFGIQKSNSEFIRSEEVRYALLALASGASHVELRGHISEALFAVLQENAEKLSAEKSLAALQENFDVFADESFEEEEEIAPAVFGASLINFPKKLKKRVAPKTLSPKFLSKLSPVSSPRL
jgi:hypothetical protein